MTSDGAGDASFSNVELLVLARGYNNSVNIVDYASPQKTVQVFGGAKISTAQSRFENASIVFDGNNDYLRVESSDLILGTGDFTIEQFVRRSGTTASGVNNDMILWDVRKAGVTGDPLVYIGGQDESFPIRFFSGGSDRITGLNAAIDTWYHVAVCRASGVTRLFVDGVQQGSSFTDSTNYASDRLTIGGRYEGVGGLEYRSFNGYLGALRYTKGVARYTSGFTPPAVVFPAFVSGLGAGHYTLDTGGFAGECMVVMMDNFEGDIQNDLILRTTPV